MKLRLSSPPSERTILRFGRSSEPSESGSDRLLGHVRASWNHLGYCSSIKLPFEPRRSTAQPCNNRLSPFHIFKPSLDRPIGGRARFLQYRCMQTSEGPCFRSVVSTRARQGCAGGLHWSAAGRWGGSGRSADATLTRGVCSACIFEPLVGLGRIFGAADARALSHPHDELPSGPT